MYIYLPYLCPVTEASSERSAALVRASPAISPPTCESKTMVVCVSETTPQCVCMFARARAKILPSDCLYI